MNTKSKNKFQINNFCGDLEAIVTLEQLKSLVSMMGIDSNYWLNSFKTEKITALNSKIELITDDNEKYSLEVSDILNAIIDIILYKTNVNDSISDLIFDAFKDDELGYMDCFHNDSILQIATFGELVYG
tara:strand:+ start:20140 stop:20526 length:387 start_codon:yes stop_codon:yes gene_type:complete